MEATKDLQEFELDVRGMTCDSCAVHVENALRRVPGVRKVNVPGWKSSRASVVAEAEVEPGALRSSVAKAGYTARVRTRKSAPSRGERADGRGGHFDLMVIGHGSAGFAAAIKGAELGYSVALVGEGTVGGTCVNVGCIPSKALIRSLEQYHRASERRFRGVPTSAGRLDWPQVLDHKGELVDDMRRARYLDVLDGYPQISHIQGRARLTAGNRVQLNDRTYAPGKTVIASGARPWVPPIPGLLEAPYLDSTSALELRHLPRSMVVLGGNAVGLELAQTYARAGVQVAVLELLRRIAPFEDEDISAGLSGYLEDEGLRIVTGLQALHVEWREGKFSLTGLKDEAELTFEAEQLLVATGRRPNTEGLGLELVGVELGDRGQILVDDQLRTSNPDIYAAGDVLGRDMFVYVAAYGGTLAAENALADAGRLYDASYIPRITFTDPQIASAGLTEAQARQQGHEVRVSTLPMAVVPRALAARDTRGLIKLVVDTRNDRLLGAHILAPEAGEIIQTAALAIRFGLAVSQLRETMFPYLTNTEGLKLALLALEKDVTLLSCCAG